MKDKIRFGRSSEAVKNDKGDGFFSKWHRGYPREGLRSGYLPQKKEVFNFLPNRPKEKYFSRSSIYPSIKKR
uniref:Uncharacterized protein n=1 Tax=candidate division WOR-3 bacterium TaxID=2052148 RepID=A0A7C3UQJ8_UNCW3